MRMSLNDSPKSRTNIQTTTYCCHSFTASACAKSASRRFFCGIVAACIHPSHTLHTLHMLHTLHTLHTYVAYSRHFFCGIVAACIHTLHPLHPLHPLHTLLAFASRVSLNHSRLACASQGPHLHCRATHVTHVTHVTPTLLACASRLSRSPYSLISFAAVFTPAHHILVSSNCPSTTYWPRSTNPPKYHTQTSLIPPNITYIPPKYHIQTSRI